MLSAVSDPANSFGGMARGKALYCSFQFLGQLHSWDLVYKNRNAGAPSPAHYSYLWKAWTPDVNGRIAQSQLSSLALPARHHPWLWGFFCYKKQCIHKLLLPQEQRIDPSYCFCVYQNYLTGNFQALDMAAMPSYPKFLHFEGYWSPPLLPAWHITSWASSASPISVMCELPSKKVDSNGRLTLECKCSIPHESLPVAEACPSHWEGFCGPLLEALFSPPSPWAPPPWQQPPPARDPGRRDPAQRQVQLHQSSPFSVEAHHQLPRKSVVLVRMQHSYIYRHA